jgi:hypothetical protein
MVSSIQSIEIVAILERSLWFDHVVSKCRKNLSAFRGCVVFEKNVPKKIRKIFSFKMRQKFFEFSIIIGGVTEKIYIILMSVSLN